MVMVAEEPELDDAGAETLERKRVSVSRGLFGRMPRTIGRYRIAGRVGEGAMGAVYAAHDPELDRPVAIKVVRDARVVGRTRDRARMIREARTLAAVSHPNVVSVYEVGELEEGSAEGSSVFIAMEFVPARDLRAWAREDVRPWREVLRVYQEAAQGLAAAHAAGVVHRDFKPSNVLLGDDGRVKVVDFGLAKGLLPGETDRSSTDFGPETVRDVSSSDITATGEVVGTPAYMAPEQLQGKKVGPAADQYAFCVAVWEASTGQRPFTGASTNELHRAIRAGKPTARTRDGSPPRSLLRVLRRGLAYDPARRWPSMTRLSKELEGVLRGARRRVGIAIVGSAGLLVAGAWWWPSHAEPTPRCGASISVQWDAGTRQRLADTFERADLEAAWGRIERGLERQVEEIAHTTSQACATNAERANDQRDVIFACLRARASATEDLVALLGDGDDAALKRADRALRRLVTPMRCLETDAGLPPPATHLADRVEELRHLIARVDLLESMSRYDEAWHLVGTLIESAETIGYAPLLAEVALQRGETASALGRHEDAERALERAYGLAHESSHDRVAMEAAKRLAHLTGVELVRKDDGLRWARHSIAAARRMGLEDPEQHVRYELGLIHMYAGETGPGAELLERAARDLERQHDVDPRRRIVVLRQLGGVLLHLERADEAKVHFTAALALAETLHDSDGHDVAALSYNLGLAVEAADEDFVEAHRLFVRAAELYGKTLGEEHPDYADARFHAGVMLAAQERYDEGLPEAWTGLDALRTALGPDDPFVIQGELSLGELLAQAGKLEEAEALIQRAIASGEAKLGEHHALVERGHRDLAEIGARR